MVWGYAPQLSTTDGTWWLNLYQQTGTTCVTNPYSYIGTNNTTTSTTCPYITIASAWTDQAQMQAQAADLYQQLLAAPAIIRRQAINVDEERQRHAEEIRRRYQEAENARRATRATAEKRAEELMLAHLTPAQRESVKTHGWFIVQGGKSKLNYQIRPATYAGNIEVDQNGRRSRLCCHVDHSIPVFDNALAQKLMLEHDEDAFLRIANRTAA